MLRKFVLNPSTRRISAAVSKASQPATVEVVRAFAAATSGKKRALNKQQLGGGSAKAAAAPVVDAKAPTAAVPPTVPPPSGGGGGGSSLPLLVGIVGLVGGGATAYFTDSLPAVVVDALGLDKPAEAAEPTVATKSIGMPVVEAVAQKEEAKVESAKPLPSNGKVAQITTFGGKASSAAAEVVSHPEVGNRVLMAPESSKTNSIASASSTVSHKPSADQALTELKKELEHRQSLVLSEAHAELARVSSVSLADLDSLAPSQLKIRLVQLSKELQERTQWEAVRLKEFLAMKEQETIDRYSQLMKKQRMELEDTMERRLKTQHLDASEEMQQAMYKKEQALQAIVDHALKLQEQQYIEEQTDFEKNVKEAVSFQLEQEFGQALVQAKEEMAQKLTAKVQQMDQMVKKVQNLETALSASKNYQAGSVQAHQMSAAALALAERLESSQPARDEFAALAATIRSIPNSVIESALNILPKTVQKTGVPSLAKLQTQFEESVHKKARQAIMVPQGVVGLEGQLLGMAFATLKVAPGADDPAPEAASPASTAEYVLSRARRHIQLGDLEKAVEQLDSLPSSGQVAFTIQDWKEAAKQRISVDKALKIIRLECALANANLAKSAPKE